jgi:NADPH:quinone reductase-like Zn-dependent oxidoreductase
MSFIQNLKKSSMQAAVYEEYGDASKLQYKTDYPVPQISDTEVLVEVKAAGVNPVDYKIRNGWIQGWPQSFPIIPGWDVAGVVKQTGSKVTKFNVGDEVYSYARPAWDMDVEDSRSEKIRDNGTYAQFIAVKEWKLAHKPKNVSFEVAASIPLAGLTSWQAIFDHAGLKAGQTLLVLNASGGCGSFAVQFAKAKGARVIGTASARNVEYVKSLGADHVIDYTKEDITKAALAFSSVIDVVYDCIGEESTKAGLAALKKDGVIVSIANWDVEELAAAEGKKGLSFLVQPSSSQLKEIAELFEQGKVKSPSLEVLALKDSVQAHEKSESGRTVGKLVLKV